MNILLDHCVPRPLRRLFAEHWVRTTNDMGWSTLKNGELLRAAASEFDLVLTVDQNLEREHNLFALPITVVVMVAHSNRLESLESIVPTVLRAIGQITGKHLIRVDDQGTIEFITERGATPP